MLPLDPYQRLSLFIAAIKLLRFALDLVRLFDSDRRHDMK